MRQLARTLLILGSVSACERAQPVVDHHERPAVGNIGQTGRVQQPAAIAQPLADASGAPAVGNIGQTGAPRTVPKPRRVQRVQRAVERPLVTSEQRPATGNVMMKGQPRPKSELATVVAPESAPVHAIVDSTGAAEVAARSPLTDRREQPMVGNLTRSGTLRVSNSNLRFIEHQIEKTKEALRTNPNDVDARERLHALEQGRDEVARGLGERAR